MKADIPPASSPDPLIEKNAPCDPASTRAKRLALRAATFFAQLAFLAGVCYIGNAVSDSLPIPIPGNICGMAILLSLLISGIVDERKISVVSTFLLKYMPVFFIPAGVTILTCLPIIRDHIPQFVAVCAITTMLVFLATASTVILVTRIQRAVCAKRAGKRAPRKGVAASQGE